MMRRRLDLPEPFRPSTPIFAPGKNDLKKTFTDISEHLAKADVVLLDLRQFSSKEGNKILDFVKELPVKDAERVVVISK